MSDATAQANGPQGEISIRVMAMPADTNALGAIFGGWVLGQMDLAGGLHAGSHAGTRAVTVAVDAMKFHKPVHVGDEVTCYTQIERVGRTSIAVKIETWVRRARHGQHLLVTEGVFTYVAVDSTNRPVEILNKQI
jgi:acyl-CoA thioesterase YciA